MKRAIYPGSFNPWHKGHNDVLVKALNVFDVVFVTHMQNPDEDNKVDLNVLDKQLLDLLPDEIDRNRVFVIGHGGLLSTVVNGDPTFYSGIIRGLRNASDFENEKIQQYWYEDLGIKVPIFYVISDRSLTHVSSSAIKALKSFMK